MTTTTTTIIISLACIIIILVALQSHSNVSRIFKTHLDTHPDTHPDTHADSNTDTNTDTNKNDEPQEIPQYSWELKQDSFTTWSQEESPTKQPPSSQHKQYKHKQQQDGLSTNKSRVIPEKVLIGYATQCNESVIQSVIHGVNVLIWTFINIDVDVDVDVDVDPNTHPKHKDDNLNLNIPIITGGPDLECVRHIRNRLEHDLGYTDVLHLISFGGWDAPHFKFNKQIHPTSFTSHQLYQAWKRYNHHDIFDGLDWDFEGNDKVSSPFNYFTLSTLQSMGEMSQYAKQDGYVVTMAPPESYLDFTTSQFSRYVNLTYHDDAYDDTWHSTDFPYHGANVYAYLLAKYEDAIDLISVQLYESYSHASYAITQLGMPPSHYLVHWVHILLGRYTRIDIDTDMNMNMNMDTDMNKNTIDKDMDKNRIDSSSSRTGYWVNFSEDASVALSDQFVSIPLSKLVIGLASGYAKKHSTKDDGKTVYITPLDMVQTFQDLLPIEIRGIMFWCITCSGQEEDDTMDFIAGLNQALHIRHNTLSW